MQHEINKMSLTVDSLDLTFDDIYKKDYIRIKIELYWRNTMLFLLQS